MAETVVPQAGKGMSPRTKKVIWIIIKLILVIGFFVGAYYILDKLGIIAKVLEGWGLLMSI
ncbi:MAG: hypothetical protein ABIJ08_04535 [Nanoarchaeota archaeon]